MDSEASFSEDIKRVGIVGLGLIGGSFALALKKNSDVLVAGFDLNSAVLAAAEEKGAVDFTGLDELYSADLIVVALPPNAAIDWIKLNCGKLKSGAIVTDVCGVKSKIIDECEVVCNANGLRFVGGHPMAGKEKGGFEHAEASLFEGASYIITPTEKTDHFAVEMVHKLAFVLGCGRITVTTPSEHDRMIAFTSQLPHVLSGAYIQSPQSERHCGFSAGSFRDVSRVAAVDENLWTELFLYNREFLSQEIGLLIENLEKVKKAIDINDSHAVHEIIKAGRVQKEKVKENEVSFCKSVGEVKSC